MGKVRKVYPSDVTDEEWWFVLPYLLLSREDAGQREHDLREVFDAVRYVARSGCSWRMVPGDLPPWAAVYEQFRRWLDAGLFEVLVADAQSVVREFAGRKTSRRPSALTAAPCSPLLKAVRGRAMTGPSDARARRSTSQSTRWDTCWP